MSLMMSLLALEAPDAASWIKLPLVLRMIVSVAGSPAAQLVAEPPPLPTNETDWLMATFSL
jgi:hypothetical protein